MANSLTALNPEYWASEMQMAFFKENVAISLANTRYEAVLHDGDTLNKPYMSEPYDVAYTKGTDITVKDQDATNEYLTVDTARVAPVYIDDIDQLQGKWDEVSRMAQRGMRQLNNRLDQAVLAEYSNASFTVDDGDVGGTSGTAISLSQSNVMDVYAACARELQEAFVSNSNNFAVVSPRTLETMRLSASNRETSFGDSVGANGLVGPRFGFDVYVSNNVPFTATLGIATNPSEGDTVVINGVTFTFNATPSGAGSVDIGNDAATSADNLVAAINDTGTAGTTYIQLTKANRVKLVKSGIVATDATTSITLVGYGDIVVSETYTDDTDVWSVQKSHSLFGIKGAIDLVVQKKPNIKIVEAEKRLGTYIYPWMLYGKKTFADGANQLVQVTIDASSWV